jgi:hypothetical protein
MACRQSSAAAVVSMKRLVITLLALAGMSGLTIVVALSMLPLPDRITPSLSPGVYSAEGVLLRAYLNQEDKWRFPVTLTALPPLFVKDHETKPLGSYILTASSDYPRRPLK